MVKIKITERYVNDFLTTILGNIVRRGEIVEYKLGSDREIENHIKQGYIEVIDAPKKEIPKPEPFKVFTPTKEVNNASDSRSDRQV